MVNFTSRKITEIFRKANHSNNMMHTIDVPNSQWLVDENGGYFKGFEETPEKQQVSMMIDGINHKPAPLCLPKGHY